MKYLLDVNGLVALGFLQHDFHERVASWVPKTAKQIIDGHLVQLATSKSAILATLDERIPGAFLVPTQS
jgi:hypothetical protein